MVIVSKRCTSDLRFASDPTSNFVGLLWRKLAGSRRHSADIGQILDHIGADSEPPHISPARGPPLWVDCGAQMDDGAQSEPQWDMAAQPAPDYEIDQRVNW